MSKAFDFARSIEGSGGFDGLALPSSTSSAAGVAGEIRNNNGVIERWSATDLIPRWRPIDEDAVTVPIIHFLVIAGGGAGGGEGQAGGGGAGGYRTSWGTGNVSGGLSAVETPITATLGTAYSITVGAGGAAVTGSVGNKGGDSTFATITSEGGGPGSDDNKSGINHNGGSGGGTGTRANPFTNAGTAGQGFDGGIGQGSPGGDSYTNYYNGGGGGGAGGAGGTAQANVADSGFGGPGLASNITGTSIYRAGGGGAGHGYNSSSGYAYSPGGVGGGGDAQSGSGNPGAANTGSGGAGAGWYNAQFAGGAGGSGVIILRAIDGLVATFSAGVTVNGTTTTSSQAVAGTLVGGTDRYWEITAASGDTVTFST